MGGVRTTQEPLSAHLLGHLLGEALNAPELIEKRSNGLKSAVAAFSFLRFWNDTNNTMLQISPCYRTFFLRLNPLSTTESRKISC